MKVMIVKELMTGDVSPVAMFVVNEPNFCAAFYVIEQAGRRFPAGGVIYTSVACVV